MSSLEPTFFFVTVVILDGTFAASRGRTDPKFGDIDFDIALV